LQPGSDIGKNFKKRQHQHVLAFFAVSCQDRYTNPTAFLYQNNNAGTVPGLVLITCRVKILILKKWFFPRDIRGKTGKRPLVTIHKIYQTMVPS
jgi:hypothetical protein